MAWIATLAVRRRRIWRPYRRRLPTALKVLLLTLLSLGFVLVLTGQDEQRRRTAEAPAEITGVELQPSIHPAIGSETLIRYRFAVDGTFISGIATRNWSLTAISDAKVCYEPSQPENQTLVEASASCPS